MEIENKDIWQLRIDKSPERGSNGYSGRNAHERINDMKKDRRRHNETQKKDFKFITRNRRPPLDNVNALLSLTYTMLTNMCQAALETVGLDPYVGFMHSDRPGRASLALDLMEELRSVFADRFVLTLINKKMIQAKILKRWKAVLYFLLKTAERSFLQLFKTEKKKQ